ncbi:MAG: DMT family transporter [SAR202 cluster bacterium]|nr:DMT family transporter [SAR202 cluster bacterium]
MDRHTQAYVYAAVAVLLWATVASAFKLTLRYLDVYQMLFYASTASTSLLFVILVAQGNIGLLKTYSLRQYVRSAGLGLISPAAYYIILFKAYSLLPAQEAQPLNMIWPLVIVLLSVPMLGQRIGKYTILAMFVSFFGTLVISTHGNLLGFSFTSVEGTLLALGSSFLWAFYWIINVKDERDEVAKLFLTFLFGLIFVTVAVSLFSEFRVDDARGLLGSAYIGAFEMGVTFVVWSKALSTARTTANVSHLIYLDPILSLIFINLFVGETILVSTIIGLVFVIGGLLLRGLDRPEDTARLSANS